MSRFPVRRGFSCFDLLAVLVMAATLLGLLVPAVHALQQGGYKQATVNNLKQINIALHNFADSYRGSLPPAFDKAPGGQLAAALHVHLLPYLEQDTVYKNYLKAEGKGEAAEARISMFIAPDDNSNAEGKVKGVQNYPANLRTFSLMCAKSDYDKNLPALEAIAPGGAYKISNIPDGTSNTISFALKYAAAGDGGSRYAATPNSKFAAFFGQNAATKPAHPSDENATYQLQPSAKEARVSPLMAQSFSKSLLVGICDGSVRSVSPEMSAQTWNSALHPSDGMPLGNDW